MEEIKIPTVPELIQEKDADELVHEKTVVEKPAADVEVDEDEIVHKQPVTDASPMQDPDDAVHEIRNAE